MNRLIKELTRYGLWQGDENSGIRDIVNYRIEHPVNNPLKLFYSFCLSDLVRDRSIAADEAITDWVNKL